MLTIVHFLCLSGLSSFSPFHSEFDFSFASQVNVMIIRLEAILQGELLKKKKKIQPASWKLYFFVRVEIVLYNSAFIKRDVWEGHGGPWLSYS